MTETQTFVIQQNGIIKGGSGSYKFDTASGNITYSGEINLKGLLPDRTFGPTIVQVDPALLASSRLQKSGDSVTIGNATLMATRVVTGETDVAISVVGQAMTGTAILDTTGPFILIKQVVARVYIPILGTLLVQADAVVAIPLTRLQCFVKKCRQVVKIFRGE